MIVALDSPLDLLAALGIDLNLAAEYRTEFPRHQQKIRSIKSSYAERNYDELFYALMRAWRPDVYLEFGVLSGYSLFAASLALSRNKCGCAIGVDLFEQYEFNKDHFAVVKARLSDLKLDGYAKLLQQSVYDLSPSIIKPDVLHVDISNNGDMIRPLFDTWHAAVSRAILFEGGSRQRDSVEWMVRYNKRAMHPVFEKLSQASDWRVFQILAFPSLTVLMRKTAMAPRREKCPRC